MQTTGTQRMIPGSMEVEAAQQAGAAKNGRRFFARGSAASSVVILLSAAIGTGVLTLPYGMSKLGIIPSLAAFAISGLVCLSSNYILFICVQETGLGTYGELMTGVLGKTGARVLDVFVCIDGVGTVVVYLLFLMDYIPQLCVLASEDAWCTDPTYVAFAASAVSWPLSCLRGLSRLRYVSTCSIVTIIFTCIVVVIRMPARFAETEAESFGQAFTDARMNLGVFQLMSMACFAFFTHTITPEIALQLARPTKERAKAVLTAHSGLMWLMYSAIATCGYLSFMSKTDQDFLTNYDVRDGLVVICRFMLSVTLVFACPIHLCPAIRALCNILEGFLGQGGNDGDNRAAGRLYDNHAARISVTTASFALALFMALRSPHIADTVSLLCTFFTVPLMFTFPALMYYRILKRTGVLLPLVLHSFTAMLWVAELHRIFTS